MSDPRDLIQRLEAATEGSRELDAAVHCAVFGPHPLNLPTGKHLDPRHYYNRNLPHLTTSLDAILALVGEKLPGEPVSIETTTVDDGTSGDGSGLRCSDWYVEISWRDTQATAKTPALALCIALLFQHFAEAV